ncbi:MAG: rubrerythrin family protein [Christensenellales bacterium]
MDFKNSQTYKNLLNSFAGESQASMRYSIFERKANEEGLTEAAAFFKEAKEEERHHATIWYSLLFGGQIPSTKENIEIQIGYENDEWTNSYEHMAQVAREEGFEEIAKAFEAVANEEEGHESHLHDLLKNLK